jgi:hypothetical protein
VAKRKVETEVYSYGVYTRWEHGTKKLPRIIDITTQIAIVPGVEFGYVLKIKGAKGKMLTYCIDHPPMLDEDGNNMSPFTGEYFVNANDYDFFLGDTVWQPYSQMVGEWLLTTWCEGKIIAQKKFNLYLK